MRRASFRVRPFAESRPDFRARYGSFPFLNTRESLNTRQSGTAVTWRNIVITLIDHDFGEAAFLVENSEIAAQRSGSAILHIG